MSKERTRIMVFGTFDVLHPGHRNFFRQARKLAKRPLLIVSVARDVNVKKIKGKRPVHNEKERARTIEESGLADRVVLGGITNHIPHILKEKPNIIALGYDQSYYISGLEEALEKKGLKVFFARLKAYKPHIYKSSKLISKK